MLTAANFSFTYAGTGRRAIENLGLRLHRGTLSCIWGDNGAGKSTLARIMCGIIPNVIIGQHTGRVEFDGSLLQAPYRSGLSTYLTQNPSMFSQSTTLREELSFIGNVDTDDRYASALRVLPRDKWDQPISTMSLGQQKLVGVLISLMHKCPIVVLDEPREFLDGVASECVRDLISTAAIDNRIILVVQSPQHAIETRNVDRYLHVMGPRIDEATPSVPETPPRANLPVAGDVVLRTEGLSYKYKGKRGFCLSETNMELREGETVGLIGPNGAGKTTLQLVLSGLYKPDTGCVWLGRERVSRSGLLKRIKCCFQNPDDQLFASTVEEEMGFGLENMGVAKEEIRARIAEQLTDVKFRKDDDPFSLSFGQQKYLTILATYLLNPEVIILDEPTAGLDEFHRNRLLELIKKYSFEGRSTVVISHDSNFVSTVCHRTYELSDGRVVSESRGTNERA